MRLAPVPKVAGGVTLGALAAACIEVATDYGLDVKPSLAALVTLLVTFLTAWLIPDEG